MKLIQRYILSEFSRLLVIAMASLVSLFIMIDLFENMDNLMSHNVPVVSAVAFFLYKVPFIVGQVSPVAVLVSVLLSLGLLSKHGEITAMKAGGVRLLRAITPLLAAGVVLSAVVILMNEYVTPAAMKKVDSFRKEWFGVKGGTFGKEGMWLKTSGGVLNIKYVDFRNNKIYGVTYYSVERPFTVQSRASARSAVWKDGRWESTEATVWTFKAGGEADKTVAKGYAFEGISAPEELVSMENFQQNMSFAELKDYVDDLEDNGYDATKYRIDLYSKLTFPLINFIMVLVAVPFALKTGRHGGIAAGVGISIVIAFSYWVVYALTRSLGQSAMIPPIVAALFPDVLFFAIGALMFGYVKQ